MNTYVYDPEKDQRYIIKQDEYSSFILPKIGEFLSVVASTYKFNLGDRPKAWYQVVYDFFNPLEALNDMFIEIKHKIDGRVKDIRHIHQDYGFVDDILIILDNPTITKLDTTND